MSWFSGWLIRTPEPSIVHDGEAAEQVAEALLNVQKAADELQQLAETMRKEGGRDDR